MLLGTVNITGDLVESKALSIIIILNRYKCLAIEAIKRKAPPFGRAFHLIKN